MSLPRSEEFFGYGSIEVAHDVECRAGHWDTEAADWLIEPGDYDLVIGASADDEHAPIRITIT